MNSAEGYRLVQCCEPAAVRGGERKEIGVGDLSMAMEASVVDEVLVEQAHRTRPKLVIVGCRGAGQLSDRLRRGHRAGVSGLADDSNEAVLSYCTGRPAVHDLGVDPPANALVVDVIAVQQRNQDINVQ